MRYLRNSLLAAVVLLLVGFAAVIVLHLNAGRLKGPLLDLLAERYGISLAVDGEFSLGLLPRVSLTATDLRLLDGGEVLNEASIGELAVDFPLSSLLRDTFVVSRLVVDSARVDIATSIRDSLPAREALLDDGAVELPIEIESAALNEARVTFGGAEAKLDGAFGFDANDQAYESELSYVISGPDLNQSLGLLGLENVPAGDFEISGILSGAAAPFRLADVEARVGEVTGSGEGLVDPERLTLQGSVEGNDAQQLMDVWARLPIPPVRFTANGELSYRFADGELRFTGLTGQGGEGIAFAVDGVVGHFIRAPFDLSPMALDVSVEGPDFDELFPKVTLPKDRVEYAGRFAVARPSGATLVETSEAMLDGIPFTASLEYDRAAETTFIASIDAAEIDVIALVTEPGDDEPRETSAMAIPLFKDRDVSLDFFLDKTFDIRVAADRVLLGYFEGADLVGRVTLDGEVLRLDIERLRFGDGELGAVLSIDESGDIPIVRLTAEGSDLRLEPDTADDGAPVDRPLDDIVVELAGSGSSLREVLASTHGWLRVEASQGVTRMGPVRQLLGIINPLELEEEETRLTCSILYLEARDGVITTRAAAIETDLLEIYATGGIDLNDDSLDLRFRIGEHDGMSMPKIFSPLVQIRGTLAEPAVELEPGNTAALVVTEGWSLLINAFEQLSRADETICAASLRRAGIEGKGERP